MAIAPLTGSRAALRRVAHAAAWAAPAELVGLYGVAREPFGARGLAVATPLRWRAAFLVDRT